MVNFFVLPEGFEVMFAVMEEGVNGNIASVCDIL